MTSIKLKIDTNEVTHTPALYQTFREHTEFEVVPAVLKVGDIEYGDIIIERKTANDFITSIRKDLFWKKLAVMQEQYNEAYLYLEWTQDEFVRAVASRQNPKYVLAAIEGAYHKLDELHYLVKHFETLEIAVKYFVDKFVRKTKEGRIRDAPTIPKKVGRTLDELRISALAMVPRLGYKTAAGLLGDGTVLDVVLSVLTEEERQRLLSMRSEPVVKGKHNESIRRLFCTREEAG